MIIKEMAESEKPREKALLFGIETLSNTELLALLIRCGTRHHSAIEVAQMIIAKAEGFYRLPAITLQELTSIKGIKEAKALELLGCIELAKRLTVMNEPTKIVLLNSKSVYEYMRSKLIFEKQEKFYVLYLDTKNKLIKEKVLFVGTLDSSVVHPREIFKEAVICSCAAMICVHNHPSGNPMPSLEDIELTKKLDALGKVMNIPLLDHIIVGKDDYYSFKANEMLSYDE